MNNTKVKLYQVVEAILYRLKTGCQWRQLPMKQFFRVKYQWQSVYHHHHNDAFDLVPAVEKMIGSIQSCGIATDGLFLNADAGFDVKDFRVYCYQQEIVDYIDQNRRNGIRKNIFLMSYCINTGLL